MTSTPCKGIVIRFDTSDCVGEIYTEQASYVKFGSTACRGIKPKVGQTVVVTGLRDLPIVGERATGVEPSKVEGFSFDQLEDSVAQKHDAATTAPKKFSAPIPY